MALKGDMFSSISAAVANGAFCDIRTAVGEEAIVHNIYYEDNIVVSRYDGVNTIIIETFTGAGVYAWLDFHVGNTHRIRVMNNSGAAAADIGYDGIYSKV